MNSPQSESINSVAHHRRSLAVKYAGITDKNSAEAKETMNKLKSQCSLFNSLKVQKGRRESEEPKDPASTCTRCNGYGMGIYRHVADGVCFKCKTPSRFKRVLS